MRLFLAIDLPKEIRDHLFTIKDKFSKDFAKINWVAKKNIHLTLKFLGAVDDKLITKIVEKLNEINFNSFELELDKLGVFPNLNSIRVLWVDVKNFNKVIELQQDIEEKIINFFEKDGEFSCHITLGRVKLIKNKNEFKNILKNLQVKNLKFRVENFTLFKSELSKDGPKYSIIQKFQAKN